MTRLCQRMTPSLKKCLSGYALVNGAVGMVVSFDGEPVSVMGFERAQYLRERFGDAIVVVQTDARCLRLPCRPRRSQSSVRRHCGADASSAPTGQPPALGSPDPPGTNRETVGRTDRARPSALGAHLRNLGRAWIPRSAFRPPPHVDTRVLVIQRRSGA